MRLIILAGAAALVLSSCVSDSGERPIRKKVDKEVLYGTFEGNLFKNNFFNFQLKFGQDWEVVESEYKKYNNGESFQAIYTKSANEYYPLDVTMVVEAADVLETPSSKNWLEELRSGLESIIGDRLIKEPMTKSTIAGEVYDKSVVGIIEASDTSYIREYCRYVDGYYVTITCSFTTKSEEAAANSLISKISK